MVAADTVSFGQVLDHLRSVAKDDGTTKGKLFERLIQSFLQTDELYRDRFRNVWLWNEYPGRNGRPDFGIDIVAEEHGGFLCAMQCKFYAKKTIVKSDIDSFLEAGTRSEFSSMMLFYTARGYGKNAEGALNGHNCKAFNFASLASSNVDWPDLASGITDIRPKPKYKLRNDQEEALSNVEAGFDKSDRGQMIMACGTGKTLVSIKMAESMVGKGGLVLYAVPSISLMHQAIRHWSEQRGIPHGYIGVCSDPNVSYGEKTDIPIAEMEIRVTTDPDRVAASMKRDSEKMTVVFSTYQSMEAVAQAQKAAGITFDLVLCDEAHRTTGVEREDGNKSAFLAVHDIDAKKRLYMTATSKIYPRAARTMAEQANARPYSMDDPATFGDEFYRLDFSDAIRKDLLSDYKVIVLGVDERYGGKALQELVNTTSDAGDINLTDAARMLGLYRILESPDVSNDVRPLQTAIVYTNRIRDSMTFRNTFKKLTVKANPGMVFSCDARHVDGTQNASDRADALQWLRDSNDDPNECRILSNAKCLSEGVDVPSLDAICFLNPKSSQVEIVQAVGRVMRKSPGKDYGYVVIPIGIPPNEKSETVLDNNNVFDMVWNILRAMRSHDGRLDIEANMADLRKKMVANVKIFGIDRGGGIREHPKDPETFPLGELDVPADALYSKIVEEVGDRRYLEHWARDVKDVVERLHERIRIVISDGSAKTKFDSFMAGLHEIINTSLTEYEGIDMLAQHLVTRRIFNALFNSDEFEKQNPMSIVMNEAVTELQKHGLETELKDIEGFYKSVEDRVSGLDSHDARQPIISELYGRFFKIAFPKMADRLGVVYTPPEIVDFILRSVDHALRENFGRGLTDEDVNVIDPFTGAGTFITRMMSPELGLIHDKDISRKYHSELFANEILLLAYYIAAVNCESMYGQRSGRFEQFNGISLTDTFNTGSIDEHVGDMMASPKRRIKRQRSANITVVIGNPPYSGGQKSANEDNKNISHPELEARVKNTYIKWAPKGNTRGLYNSYVKAIRWASDRIGDFGVIGFVSPSSWISGISEAGIRACLQEEFTDIWCFDLGGDVKSANWREAGAKPFGGGSTVGVAITILVKNPQKTKHMVQYKKIKLIQKTEDLHKEIENVNSIAGIPDWEIIPDNPHHDWVNRRDEADDEFRNHMPMGSKDAKRGRTSNALFSLFSNGLKTHRDSWVYNTSTKELKYNMRTTIGYCNTQDPDNFITDPKQAAKSKELTDAIKKLRPKLLKFNKLSIRIALYRPFTKQHLYFDPTFVTAKYRIPSFFPSNDSENLFIVVPDKSGKFSTLITDVTPDLNIIAPNQCFPLYVYENNHKKGNITNHAIKTFRRHYKDDTIASNDIFYYTYGLLHHPGYRNKYQASLVRGLPHIPMAPDFRAFRKAGRRLAKLHLGYEGGPRHSLGKPLNPIPDSPRSIKFGKKPNAGAGPKSVPDLSTIYVDGIKAYDNLPDMRYTVNSRTPIQWFADRYAFKTHKESGITNYPLEDRSGEYVQAIIERLVHVGVKSDEIISSLPEEFEPADWEPKKTGLDLHMDTGGTSQSML